MTREKLKEFILLRTEKGMSNKEISEALEKTGHITKKGSPMTSNAVSVLKSKLKRANKKERKPYTRKTPTMVTFPVQTVPVRSPHLIAFMGRPEDVMAAIQNMGGIQ